MEKRLFESVDDIWDVVDLLIEETESFNERGKDFDTELSVLSQLPFFCCTNHFLDRESQRDIEKYLYCKDYGIAPYSGAYGEQPSRWVRKHQIIKGALAKQERQAMEKAKNG
ncbi:MAG: hypothetical protein H8D23_41260 [Candidatus Brocadiales bacterium]|nr:hypothetical protein [Candidatus Brocadiales bacterium]